MIIAFREPQIDRCEFKLTAFCWNIHDGQLPQDSLADFQKERALTQLPGILNFTGYVVRLPIFALDEANKSS